MAIDLNTLFTSLGIVSGNTQSKNQYEFYNGIVWNDATITYNQKEFFDKIGMSRYDFFKQYGDERQFYEDVDDTRISNFRTFYEYGGEYLAGFDPENPPIANFSANATQSIANTVITFTNTTTGTSPINYLWDFGDGGTSNLQNPTHSYSGTGSYTVSLTASNVYGVDSEIKNNYITIGVAPIAAFTTSTQSTTPDTVITFTNTSTGTSPLSYTWDFGDGGTSTSTNPTYSYSATGSYTITLTASNSFGTDDEVKTGYIQIGDLVVASFSSSTYSTTPDTVITFTDTSTGSPTSWAWDFGDGNVDVTQNPTHSYSATGSYVVTMTASSVYDTDSTSVGIEVTEEPFSLSGGSTSSVGGDIVHTFTSDDTLVVTGSGTVQLLIVGNGNDGLNAYDTFDPNPRSGSGGAGGQVIYQASYSLSAGSYPVTITGTVNFDGNSATTGGGAAGGGLRLTNGGGSGGSAGTSNSITGTSVVYGSGGGSGAYSNNVSLIYSGGPGGTGAGAGGNAYTNTVNDYNGRNGTNYGSGGGGGAYNKANADAAKKFGVGGSGAAGVVIVRYTPA